MVRRSSHKPSTTDIILPGGRRPTGVITPSLSNPTIITGLKQKHLPTSTSLSMQPTWTSWRLTMYGLILIMSHRWLPATFPPILELSTRSWESLRCHVQLVAVVSGTGLQVLTRKAMMANGMKSSGTSHLMAFHAHTTLISPIICRCCWGKLNSASIAAPSTTGIPIN